MKKVCPRCKIEYQIADKHFHKNRLNKDAVRYVGNFVGVDILENNKDNDFLNNLI